MAEQRVCVVGALSDSEVRSFKVGDLELVLCLLDGQACALSGECTHEDLPLDGGAVQGGVLTCPWHGAKYDVRTGGVRALPAVRTLRAYPTRIDEAGVVFVNPDG